MEGRITTPPTMSGVQKTHDGTHHDDDLTHACLYKQFVVVSEALFLWKMK
jgi:hypothetical protein